MVVRNGEGQRTEDGRNLRSSFTMTYRGQSLIRWGSHSAYTYKSTPVDSLHRTGCPLPPRHVKTMLQTIIATLFALLTFILPLVEAKDKAKTAAKLAGGVLAGIIVGVIVFFGKPSPATSVIVLYQSL